MENQVLSWNQMLSLEILGLDISAKPDKMNWKIIGKETFLVYGIVGDVSCRAFTMHDIIEILPKSIESCVLQLEPYSTSVQYYNINFETVLILKGKKLLFYGYSMLKLLYQLLCFILESNTSLIKGEFLNKNESN